MPGQWSDDAFLDRLRQIGDPAADQTVAKLIAAAHTKHVSDLFKTMRANDDPLPPDAPQAYHDMRCWQWSRCWPRACRAAMPRRA